MYLRLVERRRISNLRLKIFDFEHEFRHHCLWGMDVCDTGFLGLPLPINLHPHNHIKNWWIFLHCNSTNQEITHVSIHILISDPHSGWPVLQSRVLNELLFSARKMGKIPLAIRCVNFFLIFCLIHTMGKHVFAFKIEAKKLLWFSGVFFLLRPSLAWSCICSKNQFIFLLKCSWLFDLGYTSDKLGIRSWWARKNPLAKSKKKITQRVGFLLPKFI